MKDAIIDPCRLTNSVPAAHKHGKTLPVYPLNLCMVFLRFVLSWLYHEIFINPYDVFTCILHGHFTGTYWAGLPERTRGRPWGRLRVRIRSIEKACEVGSFILLHKISRTACCFGIRTFLKQYNCYESATIWYTDHQYLAQYSEIINNLQEIPLIFCNYAVRSCGTWRKGPGQSPCNVLSISDLELYVTETSTGVCDPVTD